MTTQIKVDFSYLIGEFPSLTEQSFHTQVHIKKVITPIKEGEVMIMIMMIMIMMIIKMMIMIVIIFLVQG